MDLTRFVQLVTQATLVAVAVLTLVDYLRHRDRARLDIALMAGDLAVLFVLQGFLNARPLGDLLRRAATVLLLTQPYLLLRLVGDFRPVAHRVHFAATTGLVASSALAVAVVPPRPATVTLLLVIYFVVLEGYGALAFVGGARRTRGVTYWRLVLAAWGSALLAGAILTSGINALDSAATIVTGPIARILIVAAVTAYYAAFTPPRWLRNAWQLPELEAFLREHAGRAPGARASSIVAHLGAAAERSVGARGSVVSLIDPEGRLRSPTGGGNPAEAPRFDAAAGVVGRALATRRPAIAAGGADLGAEERHWIRSLAAHSVIAVPIATERLWGVLVVALAHGTLFFADEVALLDLFAEQAAIALDYAALVDEQQSLVGRLQQSARDLELANRELEAFSYSVSHDLRAPLRQIEGFSRLLVEDFGGALDEKARWYLTYIQAGVRQMGGLIEDLLNLSRIGRSDLDLREHPLDPIVRDVIASLEPETSGRVLEWRLRPLPSVLCDAALIKQVFANLLSNAVKFTRPRRPAVIEVGGSMDNGTAVVYVRDNGVGFDMRYVAKLFGVFQRLHRAEEFEGTGIGLATVHRIVQRHGGRVWAEAAPDRGATFYFTIGASARGRQAHASGGQA